MLGMLTLKGTIKCQVEKLSHHPRIALAMPVMLLLTPSLASFTEGAQVSRIRLLRAEIIVCLLLSVVAGADR